MTEYTQGMQAFDGLRLPTPSFIGTKSTFGEQYDRKSLQDIILATLRSIHSKDYADFCRSAHDYRSKIKWYAEEGEINEEILDNCSPLNELPNLEAIYEEHVNPPDFTRVGCVAGVVLTVGGFIAGAIGGGELAEKIVDSQYLNHLITGVGGVLGTVAGVGLGGYIFSKAEDYKFRKRDEQRVAAHGIFVQEVESYIQAHIGNDLIN